MSTDRRLGADVPGPQRVPWGGLAGRLRGSARLRRLVPLPVAVAGIRLAYALSLRSPQRQRDAKAAMEAVVSGTDAEERLERLSRRHPAARAEAEELSWRPWLLRKTRIQHEERLWAARSTGRGLMLSFVHVGPWHSLFRVLPRLLPFYQVVGDWYFETPPPGYTGHWFEHTRRLQRQLGIRPVLARGSRATLAEALSSGGTVMIALDLPGSTPTAFLGKTVYMASGTARLAVETNSLVLPMACRPRRWGRWQVELGEALDPAEHASWQDLHQALATWHEERVLQDPEYLEGPVREGAWARADRDGWWPPERAGDGGAAPRSVAGTPGSSAGPT